MTRPPPTLQALRAYADASVSGGSAAWAAVVYDGDRLVCAEIGAGTAGSNGEAETRAILLAASLLRRVGVAGEILSDSREAIAAAAPLLARDGAVTALRWTPEATNRAADILSRRVRETWQSLRRGPRRRAGTRGPRMARRSPDGVILADASAVSAWSGAPGPDGPPPRPRSLEQAIVVLSAEGPLPVRDLADRIEARWPELLALRGRPAQSVDDALASVVRRGRAAVGPEEPDGAAGPGGRPAADRRMAPAGQSARGNGQGGEGPTWPTKDG